MSEAEQVWLHSTPHSAPRKPRGFHLSQPIFLIALFISLLVIAIPTILILPQLNKRPQPQPEIEIPELIANCVFFYQRCPTSKLGVAKPQTVGQLLSEINSPLANSEPLNYSRPNSPETVKLPPSQIMTFIALDYNINPLLILTLSEMEEETVSKAEKINQKIEGAGEESAWFSIKHQQIGQELQILASEASLVPNLTNEKTNLKTITIGTSQKKVAGASSIASGVVAQYLAERASTQGDLEEKMQTFLATYEQISGMNPTTPISTLDAQQTGQNDQ